MQAKQAAVGTFLTHFGTGSLPSASVLLAKRRILLTVLDAPPSRFKPSQGGQFGPHATAAHMTQTTHPAAHSHTHTHPVVPHVPGKKGSLQTVPMQAPSKLPAHLRASVRCSCQTQEPMSLSLRVTCAAQHRATQCAFYVLSLSFIFSSLPKACR